MEIAINSLKEARGHFNAITIIPNERVFQTINKDTPLKEALSTINKFLSESLEGLIETIYEPGLINIDFADFKTILEGRGRLAYLNTIELQRKEGAIKDVAAEVLNSPLYPYTIRGAKGVLFNIAGEKNLSLADVNQISKAISELVNPEAKIIFGISQHKKYSNIIKTILLATGCGGGGIKVSSKSEKKKRRKRREEKVEKTPAVEPRQPRFTTGQAKVEIKKKQEKSVPKKVKIKAIKEEKPQESESKKEQTAASNNEERVRKNALRGNRKFVADGVDQGQRTELTGGGIIRSLMGAGQTGMTSGGGDFQLGDGRILGDGDFVAAVLARGEAQLTTKERHRAG